MWVTTWSQWIFMKCLVFMCCKLKPLSWWIWSYIIFRYIWWHTASGENRIYNLHLGKKGFMPAKPSKLVVHYLTIIISILCLSVKLDLNKSMDLPHFMLATYQFWYGRGSKCVKYWISSPNWSAFCQQKKPFQISLFLFCLFNLRL